MLVDKVTRREIKIGDTVETAKGEKVEVTDIGKDNRVYVMMEGVTTPQGFYFGVIGAEWMDDDLVKDIKTQEAHDWMKAMNDTDKMRFALNWGIPHSVFNVACQFKPASELQGIDWYKIHKSRDMGRWSHGGQVVVQCFK